MAEDTVTLEPLQTALSHLMGVERAEEVIREAVVAESLTMKDSYAREELQRVCKRLKGLGGMIAVIASSFAVRTLVKER